MRDQSFTVHKYIYLKSMTVQMTKQPTHKILS